MGKVRRKALALPKRFPGEPVARADLWIPTEDGRDSVNIKFEGKIPRGLAKVLMIMAAIPGSVSPDVDAELSAVALKMAGAKGR